MANQLGIPKGEKCLGWKHPEGNYEIVGYWIDRDTNLPWVSIACSVNGPGCLGRKKPKPVKKSDILSGRTKSCGCLKKRDLSKRQTTHGDSKAESRYFSLYSSWKNMLSRCKENFAQARDYYEKGISVCEQWLNYQNFKQWALEHEWEEGLSVDRVANDKGYEPSNCRLVSLEKQSANTSRIIIVEAFDESKSLAQWSRDSRCMVSYDALRVRIVDLQWDPEEAISKPSRNQGSRRNDSDRLRSILSAVIRRCNNKNDRQHKNYGARGIRVCDQWLASTDSFISWSMANGYKQGLTLERINNLAGYEPSNCCWATRKENNRNRRNSIYLVVGSETKTPEEWEKSSEHPRCVSAELIRRRTRDGWTAEEAVMLPKGSRRAKTGIT